MDNSNYRRQWMVWTIPISMLCIAGFFYVSTQPLSLETLNILMDLNVLLLQIVAVVSIAGVLLLRGQV